MSKHGAPPSKRVISRRVLLAAGGLVVLGEYVAGQTSAAKHLTGSATSRISGPTPHPDTPSPAPHSGGAPAAAHAGDTRVFVQPGDTLWSIAQRTRPDADPQAVVQDILSDNHLSSAAVTVGQRLWVPRR